MSDESSKLGFDASEALSALTKLKQQMDSYANSVNKMASSTAGFNAEGAKIENVLRGVSTTLTLAAGQLRQYASASNAAAAATSNLSRAQNQVQAALGRGVTLTQPLAQRVKNVVANGPTAATAKITPPPPGFNPTQGTEAGLFAAFGRKPPTANVTGLANTVKLSAKTVQEASKQMTLSWGSVIKVFGTQFAYRGVGEIVGAFTSAIGAGRKFEMQLAEIQTLSKEFATGGLDQVGAAVSKLSAEFGQPIEGVAKGLYETLSNQIGNAAESTRFLGEALSFSRSSLTSTADSVDLLSGVINSYGLTAASTADISDKLFRTIDLGRVRGEELANTIGRVLPLSSALGISFEEVAASLAHLTIQGVKANDAQTQITNVMLKLIRPTEALQEEFRNLGIATPEAAIAAYGFQGALEKLTESGGTSATEIGKLFNQIRGTRGVIGLVATDAKKYAETLDEISNKSAGAAEAAANLIQGTQAGKLTRELTAARNFLVNDFGRSAVDVLAKFIQSIGGGETAMKSLGLVLGGVAIALSIFAARSVLAFGVFIKDAATALGASEALGASIGGYAFPALLLFTLPTLIDQFSKSSTAAEDLKNRIDEITAGNNLDLKKRLSDMQPQIDAEKKALNERTAEVEKFFFKGQQLYEKDKAAAFKAQTEISANLKNQLKERESDLDKFVSVLQEIQDKPAKTQKSLANELLGSEYQVNAGRFERALNAQTNPKTQGILLAQRSNKVLQAAREAIGKGNVEFGKQLIGDAMSLAERSAGITQTRAIGEGQVNRALSTQKDLYAQIVAQQQQQANEAKNVELKTRSQIGSVKTLIAQFNSLNDQIAKKQLAPKSETNTAELHSLQAEASKTAGRIDKTVGEISKTHLPGVLASFNLDAIVRRLMTKTTSPTTGQPTSLKFAQDAGTQKVNSLLTQWSKGIDVNVRLHLQNMTGQTAEQLANEGYGKGQQAAAENNKELLKQTENQKAAEAATTDRKTANEALAESFKAIDAQAAAAEAHQVLVGKLNVNPFPRVMETAANAFRQMAGAKVPLLPEPSGVPQARQQFAGLQANARAALGTLDPTQIAQVQQQMAQATNQAQALVNKGGFGTGSAKEVLSILKQMATSFDQAVQASLKMRNVSNNLDSLKSGTADLYNLSDAVRAASGTSNSFVQSVGEIGTVAAGQVSGVEALTKALQENASTPAAHRAMGGPVSYYATGGLARGSDTVPAMLGSNEFVMNASATRQFYSQLVAMNSGGMPNYRSQGGPVTVGDVHVNVNHNQSTPMNGRQIANELRRELRRNASFVY